MKKYYEINMAMLAEAKSKQKWSQDPRNINWSGDKERYGYQMLERMGWADGKGLGKNKHGSTSNIKIKKRKQNLGLGAKESHDNDWIAQQADFNSLLSALQQHGGNAELRSEEQNKKAMLEVAKASRKRVFYKRFIRSKDTSQYSQKDMACIFGNLPSESAPATPLSQSDDEVGSEDSTASCPTIPCDSTSSGFVTYTSKQNIQEYFACRMKELQGGKGIERSSKGDEGVHCEKYRDAEKESGIIERSDDVDNQGDKGVCCSGEGEEKIRGAKRGNSENSSEKESRKKKRKKKKCVTSNEESLIDGNIVKVKKVKRKDKLKKSDKMLPNDLESVAEENGNASCGEKVLSQGNTAMVKKGKKGKKRNKLNDVSIVETISNNMGCVTEENDTASCGEEVLSKENTAIVKKGKKIKKKAKLNDASSVETISNNMGCVTEENEENSYDEKSSFNSGRVKTKPKTSRKRRVEDDVSVATDKDPSHTREDSVDNVSDLNDARKAKKRKQKRRKKRSEVIER